MYDMWRSEQCKRQPDECTPCGGRTKKLGSGKAKQVNVAAHTTDKTGEVTLSNDHNVRYRVPFPTPMGPVSLPNISGETPGYMPSVSHLYATELSGMVGPQPIYKYKYHGAQ